MHHDRNRAAAGPNRDLARPGNFFAGIHAENSQDKIVVSHRDSRARPIIGLERRETSPGFRLPF
jgi:hypothetical protein